MRDASLSWQKILADGFSSVQELLNYVQLPPEQGSVYAQKEFSTRVTRRFAAKIQPGNPQDPLLLQILPIQEELNEEPGFSLDPLQEATHNPIPGLIHKYHGRVLLTVTGTCAINCRFCFRRHFPYGENNPGKNGWQKTLQYIANDCSIQEVILSGGDPLLASDETLETILSHLATIPHVQTIRIHSRVPIVLPERLPSVIKIFDTTRFKIVLVMHCNHPQELDRDTLEVCALMKQAGWLLLNQSVLLKGVNDHAPTLILLSQRLFELGVLPYYLHKLDPVQGAHHFSVSLDDIFSIYEQLRQQLPGYLVPKLAQEEAHFPYKSLLLPGR